MQVLAQLCLANAPVLSTGVALPPSCPAFVCAVAAAGAVVWFRLQLNAAFVAIAAYTLYYLVLEPVAGLSWSAMIGLPMWLTASAFQQHVANAGLWALGVHVFSWYMQVGLLGKAGHMPTCMWAAMIAGTVQHAGPSCQRVCARAVSGWQGMA